MKRNKPKEVSKALNKLVATIRIEIGFVYRVFGTSGCAHKSNSYGICVHGPLFPIQILIFQILFPTLTCKDSILLVDDYSILPSLGEN